MEVRGQPYSGHCQRQVSAVHTRLDFGASLVPTHYSSTKVTDIQNQMQVDGAFDWISGLHACVAHVTLCPRLILIFKYKF